jgi:hypothetical protein
VAAEYDILAQGAQSFTHLDQARDFGEIVEMWKADNLHGDTSMSGATSTTGRSPHRYFRVAVFADNQTTVLQGVLPNK